MKKLPNVFPKSWSSSVDVSTLDFLEYRNLLHFKSTVSKLKQKEDNKCNVTYEKAVHELINGYSKFDQKEYETVRNLVRSNLLKRGLLTEEVYESFRYSTDGTVIDIDMGKFANGEPDCLITPSTQYVDFFYELYVNISYPASVEESTIIQHE